MAISPVNVTRVSQGLRTNLILESLRRNQRDTFLAQSRIAAGRSFVSRSEDPVRASRALDLTQAIAYQEQFAANARHGDNFLAAADTSLSEISSLLIQASEIASAMVGTLASPAEREAEAEVVASIREQLQIVGNRQFNGRYLFGGRDTLNRPFVDGLGGIEYVGDIGQMFTRLSDELFAPVNVAGSQLFGALSSPIATTADLTPVLNGATRLEDITGANGEPIGEGTLLFNETTGVGVFTVDLAAADTIGGLAEAINAAATAAGSGLTASVTSTGLQINPGSSAVTIADTGTGEAAVRLGILTLAPTSATIVGAPLTARVTRLTPIADLAGGAGIDISSGLVITNGGKTATVDLSAAVTVQDIINAINNAGVSVRAQVNSAGTGIDVFNQVSGSSLFIGENGGTTASDLGIRTFDTATPLDALNFGIGVTTVDGQDDIRITAKDGSTVDVNLDGAQTIGDVIALINAAATAAGVPVTASFASVGNGLRIQDSTGGSGNLEVSPLNMSTAATQLGLQQSVSGTEMIGTDVNPTRTDGILGALIDLEQALRSDDTQGISRAAGRIDDLRANVIRIHGIIGARSQAMSSKRQQIEDAAAAGKIFLSEIQDLDYAEAVTQMQQAIVRLQANMQTSSITMNLSLMDFLR